MLKKYQTLAENICTTNPTIHILLSGLLPRAENRFPGSPDRTDGPFFYLKKNTNSVGTSECDNIDNGGAVDKVSIEKEHTLHEDVSDNTDTVNSIDIKQEFPSFITSQHALAKYVVDNNLISLVPSQGAFVVQGRNGKYCVTLFPKETCQCPSTTTCCSYSCCKDEYRSGTN